MVIFGGIALLALGLLAGRFLGGGTRNLVLAAQIFIPVWLALAGLNMYIGVTRAGYSVSEELPIFLLIFALPAALAAVAWWKFS
jgi:hypothetical protein